MSCDSFGDELYCAANGVQKGNETAREQKKNVVE